MGDDGARAIYEGLKAGGDKRVVVDLSEFSMTMIG